MIKRVFLALVFITFVLPYYYFYCIDPLLYPVAKGVLDKINQISGYDNFFAGDSCNKRYEALKGVSGAVQYEKFEFLYRKYCGLPKEVSERKNMLARYTYEIFFKDKKSQKTFLNAADYMLFGPDDREWGLEEIEGIVALVKWNMQHDTPLEISEFSYSAKKRWKMWRNPDYK